MPKNKNMRVERRVLADGTIKEYRYHRAKRQSPAECTVRAAIAAWQRSPEWELLSPATAALHVRYIEPLFLALGAARLAHVRTPNLLTIRDQVVRQSGHGAARRYCAAAGKLFSWAVDREMIAHSPAVRLTRNLTLGSLPTWTEEQARKAMSLLPEHYRRVVVLAYHTGQRRGDLCAMRWSDYDGSAISVRQQKTGAELSIPVNPELKAELCAWRMDATAVTILQMADGRPWRPHTISRKLPGLLERIGLPLGLNVHGLRKLAAVRLAEAGCTAHEIASITGHRTLAMVQHYTEAARQRTLADVAMLRLDQVHKRHKNPLSHEKSKS